MKLYQVIRQVVPDRVVFHDDDVSTVVPGLNQVVWEGRSIHNAKEQLDKARSIKVPRGTVYVIHEAINI